MATFVLVHGAWHGAWCWRRVARLLTRNDHEVFTPTLTGLAERSHLLRPDTDLETHVLDIVNVIKFQQLRDVVLVGHSYAGMVISGVAEKMESEISSFVMLDAFLPESGHSIVDLQPPHIGAAIIAAARDGASVIPPRPAAMFNVNPNDRDWVDAQCTSHPIKCFLQKLTLTGARERIAKKTYIRASGFPSDPFDQGLERARSKRWQIREIACGHDAMLDMPAELAALLESSL